VAKRLWGCVSSKRQQEDVTVDTVKQCIIPIETMFKRFTFSVHKAA